MKKIMATFIAFTLVFILVRPVTAASDIVKIGSQFVLAVTKKKEDQAKTHLASNVVIPEVKEDTPINQITGLPSPEGNVVVAVAYFSDGENISGRIAFIWEMIFTEEKITDIRVIYDGSSPTAAE